jgi:uncharacterized membrane protein
MLPTVVEAAGVPQARARLKQAARVERMVAAVVEEALAYLTAVLVSSS